MDRRVALSGVALSALLAPVPVHTQTPPIYNWTGFYVGVTAGGGSLSNRWEDVGNSGNQIWFDGTSQTFRSSAAVVGGYAGFNWQVARNLVVGVESDLTYNFAKYQGVWQGNTFAGVPAIESNGLLQWTLRARRSYG